MKKNSWIWISVVIVVFVVVMSYSSMPFSIYWGTQTSMLNHCASDGDGAVYYNSYYDKYCFVTADEPQPWCEDGYPQGSWVIFQNCGAGLTSCTDSDGGRIFNVKGTTTTCDQGDCASYTDSCAGSQITEYWCDSNTFTVSTDVCGNGCENGACKDNPSNVCTAGQKQCMTDPYGKTSPYVCYQGIRWDAIDLCNTTEGCNINTYTCDACTWDWGSCGGKCVGTYCGPQNCDSDQIPQLHLCGSEYTLNCRDYPSCNSSISQCTADADCVEGQVCTDGICGKKKGIGFDPMWLLIGFAVLVGIKMMGKM